MHCRRAHLHAVHVARPLTQLAQRTLKGGQAYQHVIALRTRACLAELIAVCPRQAHISLIHANELDNLAQRIGAASTQSRKSYLYICPFRHDMMNYLLSPMPI